MIIVRENRIVVTELSGEQRGRLKVLRGIGHRLCQVLHSAAVGGSVPEVLSIHGEPFQHVAEGGVGADRRGERGEVGVVHPDYRGRLVSSGVVHHLRTR